MTPWPFGVENPALLPLLLAALVPLLLHILDRRRARVVDWPGMRFIVLGSKARMRRWRIREALLILSRSLVALCVALALARPVWKETLAVRASADPSRAVVLVMDASRSMSVRTAGASRLDRARDGALRVLDTLGPGCRVGLVTFPSDENAAPAIFSDAGAARDAVRRLTPTAGIFRLATALDAAATVLDRIDRPSPEIHIFTDLQWSMAGESEAARWRFIRNRFRAPGGAPSIRIVDCGLPEEPNAFVSMVRRPALAAGTDEPATIHARIEVSGPLARRSTVTATFLADGVELAAEEVAVSPAAPSPVEFRHLFTEAGTQLLTVAIPPDALAADDSRRLYVEVLDRIEVLVCGPTRRSSPAGAGAAPLREADYVDLALQPRSPGTPEPRVLFRVNVEESPEPSELSRHRVVVVAGLRDVSPGLAAGLESFARGGGGILLFAGSGIDAAAWSRELFRGGRGLLPARPAPAEAASAPGIHPRDILTTHPALSVFAGGEEGDLASIRVERWTRFSAPAREASVLGRVDAESPWILEAPFGAGKVIVVATSAAPGDSDLPATPLFLPLVNRLVRYLAARDPGTTDSAATQLPQPNVPPDESRLERVSAAALDSLRTALGAEVCTDAVRAASPSVLKEVRRELWPIVLLLALLLTFSELVLARGFARAAPAPVARNDGKDRQDGSR